MTQVKAMRTGQDDRQDGHVDSHTDGLQDRRQESGGEREGHKSKNEKTKTQGRETKNRAQNCSISPVMAADAHPQVLHNSIHIN